MFASLGLLVPSGTRRVGRHSSRSSQNRRYRNRGRLGRLFGHRVAQVCVVCDTSGWPLTVSFDRAYIVPAAGMQALELEHVKLSLIEEINLWLKPKVAHYKQLIGGTVFVEELPRL